MHPQVWNYKRLQKHEFSRHLAVINIHRVYHSWESFNLFYKWPSYNTENTIFVPRKLWISLLQSETDDNSFTILEVSHVQVNSQVHTHIYSKTEKDAYKIKKTRTKGYMKNTHKLKAIFTKCLQSFSLSFVLQFT